LPRAADIELSKEWHSFIDMLAELLAERRLSEAAGRSGAELTDESAMTANPQTPRDCPRNETYLPSLCRGTTATDRGVDS